MKNPRSRLASLLARAAAATVVLLAAGCSYTIEGKVVRGPFPVIQYVDASDTRLAQPPAAGVNVTVVRDANSLGATTVGSGTSDSSGRVEIPLSAAGAGLTDEEWLIRVVGGGFGSQSMPVRLPSNPGRKILLIIMAAGKSIPFERSGFDTTIDDALRQVEQFSR